MRVCLLLSFLLLAGAMDTSDAPDSADAREEPVTAESDGGTGHSPEPSAAGGQAGAVSGQEGESAIDLIVLVGRVAIKGSEPHTMVVLTAVSETGRKVDYQLVGPLMAEIGRKYQNKTVRLRGRIVREPVGPGFPAQFEVFAVEQP